MQLRPPNVTFTDLPFAISLYGADVFPLDQNGGDGYTKKVSFSTLYTQISSAILTDTRDRVVQLENRSSQLVPISGAQMSGYLTLTADPINSLHATTKQYADNLLSTKSSLSASNRAWVSFNGCNDVTNTASLCASSRYIYSSFNVLSVIRASPGVYTIHFSNNAMTINNYAVNCTSNHSIICGLSGKPQALYTTVTTTTGSLVDTDYISVICAGY